MGISSATMSAHPVVTSARAVMLAIPVLLAGIAPGQCADRLETMFKRYVAKEQLPGAVLLVSGPAGRRVLVAGVANRETGAPVTPETRFYVASVGKMPIAVMALQQIEESRYRLDSPVAPLVSDLPGAERIANVKQATVSNLLNHTSGIPEYFNDSFSEAADNAPNRVWSPKDALPFAAGLPATGRVGAKYLYTNTNYLLLGDLIAKADGGTLADSFLRRIFRRAGMTSTTVGASPADPSLAHAYADHNETGELEDVSRLGWLVPLGDGPITTTAADMERFLFALFRDGALLSPAMLERMKTPTPQEETYGYGLSLYEDENGHCLYHSGYIEGFNAQVAYYVEQKRPVAATRGLELALK